MPTITGSHIITGIRDIHGIDDTTYSLALRMIESASYLFGDGDGGDLGENVEYERGMAELICDTCPIPMEHCDDIIQEIHHQATVKREAGLKQAVAGA